MRATRILLLRHAETAAPDRFHGAESDVGLGEAGWTQAETVAASLQRVRPDALYCSGMRRARETAGPIGRACERGPRILEWLHECRMGRLSGMLREEGWEEYQRAKAHWIAGDLHAIHEGGESYAQVQSRVVPGFRALATEHAGQCVVVVAHGVVIRVLVTSLVAGYGPEDFGRIGIEYVSVKDLRWDGAEWRMVSKEEDSPQRHEGTKN